MNAKNFIHYLIWLGKPKFNYLYRICLCQQIFRVVNCFTNYIKKQAKENIAPVSNQLAKILRSTYVFFSFHEAMKIGKGNGY